MANIFLTSVYRINAGDLVTSQLMGFSPQNVKFRPPSSPTFAGPNNQRVYGIIQELPRGLVVDSTQYYVIETVQALAALANV